LQWAVQLSVLESPFTMPAENMPAEMYQLNGAASNYKIRNESQFYASTKMIPHKTT
jgi:hypothetical protein